MVEGHWLSGIRSGTPRCDVISQPPDPCCNSSSVRLRLHCIVCETVIYRFFCDGHDKGLVAGKVLCYHCKAAAIRIKVS
jgi:hypothetical protein